MLAAFAAEGGNACTTPAEFAQRCSVVIVLVVNAAQTEAVLLGENGAAPRLEQGSVVKAACQRWPAIRIGYQPASNRMISGGRGEGEKTPASSAGRLQPHRTPAGPIAGGRQLVGTGAAVAARKITRHRARPGRDDDGRGYSVVLVRLNFAHNPPPMLARCRQLFAPVRPDKHSLADLGIFRQRVAEWRQPLIPARVAAFPPRTMLP